MTPFVGFDNPLSRVTLAAIEDIGYEVNYDAADDYTKDDLGPTCRCDRRLTGETRNQSEELFRNPREETTHHRKLTDAGLEYVTMQGRAFLETMPLQGRSDSNEAEYVGAESTFVYAVQDETIFVVKVDRS